MARRDPLPDAVVTTLRTQGGAASCVELLRSGATDNDLERWVRSAALIRLSRSRYALPLANDPADDRWTATRNRHLHQAAGVLTAAPDAVAALRTAAIVHGLPVDSVPPRPEVIRHPDTSALLGARVVRTVLPETHRENRDGIEITTLDRTAVDLALDLPTPRALICVDAALSRGASITVMARILSDRGPVRGCRQARRTLDWADGHAESALESRSRGELLLCGLPRPRCNVTIRWNGQEFRVDDLWDDLGIVGEADGRIKYEGNLVQGDSLWKEKIRQEWLETAAGMLVVRWTSSEIQYAPQEVADRWVRARDRRRHEPWQPPPGLTMAQAPLPDPRAVLIRQNLG